MHAPKPRGLFIVVEGLDRSGKDTVVNGLVRLLPSSRVLAPLCQNGEGAPVLRCGFPRRETAVGKRIDAFLRREVELSDQEIHELYSEDRWEAVPELVKLIEGGTTVVCCRYAYSGAVYTAAKGYKVESACLCDKGLPSPDVVLFMDADADMLTGRGGYGEERFEELSFQGRVFRAFGELEELVGPWKHIPGNLSPQDSILAALEHVSACSEHIMLPLDRDLFSCISGDTGTLSPAQAPSHG